MVLEDILSEIETPMKIDEFLKQLQSKDPENKENAKKALMKYIHMYGLSGEVGALPSNANIADVSRKLAGILGGIHLNKNLPKIAETAYESFIKVDPILAYEMSFKKLTEIGDYAGVSSVLEDEHSKTIKAIGEGNLESDAAKNIASEYANKYLRKALEANNMDKEEIDALVELYTEVWSDDAWDNTKITNYRVMYGKLKVKPWLEKNKDNIMGYANDVSKVLSESGKAKEYNTYKMLMDYAVNTLKTYKGISNELQKHGMSIEDI